MVDNPTPAVEVTQEDISAANALDDALGFLTDNERPLVLQAFARHRIAHSSSRGGEMEKLREALDPHVTARIKHVLRTVANYADAERNGGEFADDLRRDIACMNGDVVADDLAILTTYLASPPPVEGLTSGEGDCTCQRYPTHQANDCPLHGLEAPFDGVPPGTLAASPASPAGSVREAD